MLRHLCPLSILCIAFEISAYSVGAKAQAKATQSVAETDKSLCESFAWLVGTWERGSSAKEVWICAGDDVLLGMGYVETSQSVSIEYLRISEADGDIFYYAQPGGKEPIAFRWIHGDGQAATFINPEHDFPQRIEYVRDDDQLQATISKDDGTNAMIFGWQKTDAAP